MLNEDPINTTVGNTRSTVSAIRTWPSWAAGLLGIAWFLSIGGGAIIDPRNTKWLSGDWLQHWLGFLYFTHEPWGFPLGKLSSIPYPIGTSIVFTDSNPLVAIPTKLLAHFLPQEFQLIGMWLLVCFGLQGYFGSRLTSVVTKSPLHQLLGGCLFALSPVLTTRIGHDTLCAHWLILGLLFFGLRHHSDSHAAFTSIRSSVLFVWLSVAIHPYLAAMCLVLALATFARLYRDRLLGAKIAILSVAAMFAGVLLIAWLIGYFGGENRAIGGFGLFSADLLTLFDPRETSRLIPALPTQPAQWEGFGFLGTGGLALLAIAVAVSVVRPPRITHGRLIVLVVVGAMALYSLSSDIALAGHVIIHVRRGYRLLGSLTSMFRASGRFIWPLHYVLLLFGLWGLVSQRNRWRWGLPTVILAAAIVGQAIDFKMNPYWFSPKQLRQAPTSNFALVRGHFDHLSLYPPQIGSECGFPLAEDRVYRYELLAYRLGLTFNSGSFARVDQSKVDQQCAGIHMETDELDRRTVYVVSADFVAGLAAHSSCNRFDGDWVCVSRSADQAFRTLVETGREPPR
jgi:uncharacterized protein DUF6311